MAADGIHSQTFGLAWLLHPIAGVDFLRNHWETQPLFISRNDPDYFKDLPGLDAIDELITATTSGRTRGSVNDGYVVKTHRNGDLTERPIRVDDTGIPDIQDIYRAYHDGYSIVVNQVHRRSAAVALLCRTLEASIHHPLGANLYLTPPHGQGFRPHVDTHDVLILQLHGEKEWRVGTPSNELPLASAKHKVDSLSDHRQFSLAPGDVLYLPRGFPHEAMTARSSSLHLTVGVYVHRWADLFSEVLALLAADQLEFRKALPAGFFDLSLDPAHISSLADYLALALADSSLRERAKERLRTKLFEGAKVASRGHFRSIDAISGLTAKSVVVRAPGLLCRVRSTTEESLIEFATNYVAGPLLLEPALEFIAEREQFAIYEVPGPLTTEDKIDLVSRLISEGLLRRHTNQGDSHYVG